MADAHDMSRLKRIRHNVRRLANKLPFVLLSASCCVYVGLGSNVVHAHDSTILFNPDWEDDWHYRNRAGQCELHAHIRHAGEVRFTASARQRLAFEYQAHRDLFAGQSVSTRSQPGAQTASAASPAIEVVRVTPPWHPEPEPRQHALGDALHVSGGGAIARLDLAQKMLWALRSGYYLELRNPAWFDGSARVQVLVPAQAIQPALEKFLRCAQSAVSVAWNDVSRTRVTYPVDRHALDARFETRLLDVLRYALLDPDVRKIYVDGHADASGERGHNVMLSKRRAEVVADFLRRSLAELAADDQTRGREHLPEVVVRFHGSRYPAAKNTTAQGKARNRRTTVRLERMGEVLAAR